MKRIRTTKCRYCKKYLGESLKDFPEGTVDDGDYLYCNEQHYQKYRKSSQKERKAK